MATTFNLALANILMDGLGDSLDLGFIDIYDGTLPADPEDPPDGTLLVSCALLADAYATATGGVAIANLAVTGTAVASGTAQYAQQRNAANTAWMYGNVTASGGGGTVEIDNGLASTAITSGQAVSISDSTLTQQLTCP